MAHACSKYNIQAKATDFYSVLLTTLILNNNVAEAATIKINQRSDEVQMGIILHGNKHWRR